MRKQSSKKRWSVRFNGHISSFPGCCAIGTAHNFTWTKGASLGPRFDGVMQYEHFEMEKRPLHIVKKDIIGLFNRGFRLYPVLYIALPDSTDLYKTIITLVKKWGWKEENTAPSKHGSYDNLVFSMTQKAWSNALRRM